MVETTSVETGGAANDTVNLVAFVEEELGARETIRDVVGELE